MLNSRNTPAYAGKTIRRDNPVWKQRKHPRLRGEDPTCFMSISSALETPPLTRGRRGSGQLTAEGGGNTPAYAGKTSRALQIHEKGWKHPRLRGEDPVGLGGAPGYKETPPLTRGRLKNGDSNRGYSGNTPAYAGKTATFCTKTNLTIQNTLLLTDLSVFH